MYVKKFLMILALVLAGAVARSQRFSAVQVIGVGGTFPAPILSKWFIEFEKVHPNIHFSYLPSGSGAGIASVTAGEVQFGASDAPLTDKQVSEARVHVLHFPTVLGAVVPI